MELTVADLEPLFKQCPQGHCCRERRCIGLSVKFKIKQFAMSNDGGLVCTFSSWIGKEEEEDNVYCERLTRVLKTRVPAEERGCREGV